MDEKIPEPLSKPVEPTKPGANVPPTSATPSATVSSTPMGMPASNVGKSGGGKKVLVVLLVLILMASTAAFGYLWWQARSAQAQVAQAQTDKEAAEKKASEAEAKVKELEEAQGPNSDVAANNDERRKDDLNAIATGLEQYYNDLQAYPATLDDLIKDKYLKEVPKDPVTKGYYTYVPQKGNSGNVYIAFVLQATLQNEDDKDVKADTVGIYEVVNKQ